MILNILFYEFFNVYLLCAKITTFILIFFILKFLIITKQLLLHYNIEKV